MAEITVTNADGSRYFLEPDTAVSSADLSEGERGQYRELLADIDGLQRIEDEQVVETISLATQREEAGRSLQSSVVDGLPSALCGKFPPVSPSKFFPNN